MPGKQRIANIVLDERTVVRRSPQLEHERRAAILDLLENNHFAPASGHEGPFNLYLGAVENRLVFDVCDLEDGLLTRFTLPMNQFRAIIKDYFTVCESYLSAIKTEPLSKIEAFDMGRRALHDEGGEMLRERLAGKADIDTDTARRLFSLICVLHIRGRP